MTDDEANRRSLEVYPEARLRVQREVASMTFLSSVAVSGALIEPGQTITAAADRSETG